MSNPGITQSRSVRRTLLDPEGFYALSRAGVFLLLIAATKPLTGQYLWPITATSSPIIWLIWAYGVLTLVTLATLIVKQPLVAKLALIFDIAIFSALTLFNTTSHDLFYPLYLLPLVGAATQLTRRNGLLVGALAAIAYCASFLFSTSVALTDIGSDALALLALTLRGVVMVLIPWLAGGLAELWSTSNRHSVEVAEEKRQQALEHASGYRDRMRALYEVAYTLSSNPEAILDITLSESQKLVPYSAGAVLLATGPDELSVAAAHGTALNDRQQLVKLGSGPVSAALREPEPFIIEDLRFDPIFNNLEGLMRNHAACAIPLRSGSKSYGAMLVAGESAEIFTEERVEMLAALANYALVALQNAQLIHDLRSERTKLLSKEEEVRHQLARDLHDGPAQALAAITMNVEFIKRLLDRDPKRVLTELDKLGALSKRTTHEVRTMLFELRPLALETQGLGETLRQYFERFQGATTDITLEANDLNVSLDTRTEGTLFNIIQEAVNNALKHAHATHIWVRVKHIDQMIETTIQDDGNGFDLQKVKETYDRRGSFGLLNIEERAQLVGGSAELSSAPGQGTTVRVLVPVQS